MSVDSETRERRRLSYDIYNARKKKLNVSRDIVLVFDHESNVVGALFITANETGEVLAEIREPKALAKLVTTSIAISPGEPGLHDLLQAQLETTANDTWESGDAFVTTKPLHFSWGSVPEGSRGRVLSVGPVQNQISVMLRLKDGRLQELTLKLKATRYFRSITASGGEAIGLPITPQLKRVFAAFRSKPKGKLALSNADRWAVEKLIEQELITAAKREKDKRSLMWLSESPPGINDLREYFRTTFGLESFYAFMSHSYTAMHR